MELITLLDMLLDGTNVVIYDMDGNELERYDGRDSLSGDYDYCEVMNVYTHIMTTSYGHNEPFIVIDIDTEQED